MADAEDTLQEAIIEKMNDNKDKFVTFDLIVASTYQVLEEDPLVEILKTVHKGMTNPEQKAIRLKLQKMKQLPRRCERVAYEAFIYADGKDINESVEAETEHGDKWLNDLFNEN